MKTVKTPRRDPRQRCPHGNRITPGSDGPCGCRVLDAGVVAEENRQLVKGLQRVGVLSVAPQFSRVEGVGGSSPALAIQCPVCSAPEGVYCVKASGERQIIAHKKRSERARAERRARGEA